jgi:hypothetical protein
LTEIVLAKVAGGTLAPVDQQGIEAIAKLKLGSGVKVTIKRVRNLPFHRKIFALFNFAFDAWEPTEPTYKGQVVRKNFKQFRNDLVVLAGFFETAITLRGEARVTAKSLSFDSMPQEEFDLVYSAVIDVVLQKILTNYTRDDLDNTINQLLEFT